MINRLRQQPISKERIAVLEPLRTYLENKLLKNEPVHLNYICTHNSRRSQFAQCWSTYLSHHFQLPIHSYSGGTEVTACHPSTIAALERFGFKVKRPMEQSNNPIYQIQWKEDSCMNLYSKLHSEAMKSNESFAALMCCSEASDNCPFVPGSEHLVSLNYTDPKWSDGTEEEVEAYDACCLQIGSEIYYVFSHLMNS